MLRLIATCAAAWACAAACAAAEILGNGGFEESQRGGPAVWRANGPVALVAAARSGLAALKLGDGGRVLQCFALEPDLVFEATVWARGSGRLFLSFYEYKDGPGQGYAGGAASGPLDLSDQWRQFHLAYSQGPNETVFKGLCFALGASGPGAEVFVDDASLEKRPFAGPQPNLLANPTFRDADNDAQPDGWRFEARRVSRHVGPGGRPALRIAATLYGDDYMPDPQFRQWWSWRRWGPPGPGSGWPGLPWPKGGVFTTLLESDFAAVRPGRRYDVEWSLRRLEVWGEFAAVRWLTADKKPAGGERIGYSYRDGVSSDWVRYVGRVTSPPAARYASISIGAMLGSGTLWVAQPALREGRGAPGRHEPRFDYRPAELREGVPQAPAPPRPAGPAVRAAAPAQPGVVVDDRQIRVTFPGGVGLQMPLRAGRLVGVTRVACGTTLLRNPAAPPLAPLVETSPAREYVECLYEGWQPAGEGCEIHSRLRTAAGKEDRLDWIFAPASQTLAGRPYQGLRYGYRFQSKEVQVLRIVDRATWELGGTPAGLQVGRPLYRLGAGSDYCQVSAYRFVGAESFEYQAGPAGTLLVVPDRDHTVLSFRSATPAFVILHDVFLFPETRAAATTLKSVLHSALPGGADDWAGLRDALVARQRHQLGAPPEPALVPTAMILGCNRFKGIGPLHCKTPRPERPEYYRWVADEAVPRLAELGFRRVMITLGTTPWNWPGENINELAPQYAESFKRLCDRAHAHGLGVISWYGTLQNRDQSPVWSEHPEFVLMGPRGQRARTYYSPWGWPGKLAGGFGRFTLDRLRAARERTGLDGLWLDSYSNATHLMETASFADAVRQADGLLPWQAAIERLGYFTYCEGHPHSLGIPASGWEAPDDWSRFRPEIWYKCAPYLQQPDRPSPTPRFLADPARRHYYRMLANLCCPILDPGQFGDDAAPLALVRQANRDFNAVADLMQRRRLLDENGVEWSSPTGRAVFAFQAFDYTVPPEFAAHDVTAGTDLTVPANRRVGLKPYHTYRLTPKAPNS